jgi:poly(3-hydroxybutyrate) depolymerase
MNLRLALRSALPGQIVAIGTDTSPELPAFVYMPRLLRDDAPLFVSVHGYARNALSHAIRFRDLADRHGAVCLVPCFSRERHHRYQQLAPGRGGESPDGALCTLLDAVIETLRLKARPVVWFGFSGGGQFVHRFALRHPHRVAAAVIAAAGWYTFPDASTDWPRGLRVAEGGPSLDLEALLCKDLLVLIGDRDTQQDELLNCSPAIVAQQGGHRLERAERWVAAMHAAAKAHGVPARVTLAQLPGAGHSFETAMDRHNLQGLVASHLFPTTGAPSQSPQPTMATA